MECKIALIIIFNHKYDKNIEVLEKIYQNRFSDIYYLVPFYDGEKPNVIPVYGSSYYFQGYIAQGLHHFYSEDYSHYLFIADDLFLNPIINEENYLEHFKLNENTSFIPQLVPFHTMDGYWKRTEDMYAYQLNKEGVEIRSELPTYDEAIRRFEKHNIHIEPLKYNQVFYRDPINISNLFSIKKIISITRWYLRKMKHYFIKKELNFNYPILHGYSDIFLIDQNSIKEFGQYCGVFSATALFVETAIPTSFALSTSEYVLNSDLLLHGKALWSEQDFVELDKYDYALESLLSNFPPNYLYLHPIKLSKWKM